MTERRVVNAMSPGYIPADPSPEGTLHAMNTIRQSDLPRKLRHDPGPWRGLTIFRKVRLHGSTKRSGAPHAIVRTRGMPPINPDRPHG